MAIWAAAIAVVLAAITYLTGDLFTVLSGLGEIAVVVALFALVCATEAFNN